MLGIRLGSSAAQSVLLFILGIILLAVEIFVRIRKEFNVEFPLHVFFQAPTIAGSAANLERLLASRRMQSVASS